MRNPGCRRNIRTSAPRSGRREKRWNTVSRRISWIFFRLYSPGSQRRPGNLKHAFSFPVRKLLRMATIRADHVLRDVVPMPKLAYVDQLINKFVSAVLAYHLCHDTYPFV